MKTKTDEAMFQELVAKAREWMEELRIPGVAIGLAVEDKEYTAGLGITSIENPLPVTPETLFRIGSTTKTYTATALFRLVEQGKISLDNPVRNYIPAFKVQDEVVSARATVCQLLNHTSGWMGDFFLDTGEGDDALEKLIAAMADVPQITPLGAIYTYNNVAVNVAGRIIEIISGKPYETAIREMILEPLELGHSFFTAGEVMLHRFALGHVVHEDPQSGEEKVIIAAPWVENRSNNPCGGLASNVLDQLKYVRFHMGNGTTPKGERLLNPETIKLMQTPAVNAGEEGYVGLNWFIQDIGGVRFVSHGGSSNGQQEELWLAPEKHFALSVMTNLDRGTTLIERATQWVREHFLGVVAPEPVLNELPAGQLSEYAAGYVMAPTGDLFAFTPDKGGLRMTHTPGDYSSLNMEPPMPFPPTHCCLLCSGPLADD